MIVCVHVCVYIYIYIYMYTHIHTYMPEQGAASGAHPRVPAALRAPVEAE